MAKKILMIDDNEMMRIFFRDIFWIHSGGQSSYDVMLSDSIEKARQIIASKDTLPDIIFLDLSMPTKRGDGTVSMETQPSIEFLKEFRQNPAYNKIPVIVFSGYNEPGLRDKVKEAGGDHYLVKGEYMPKELIDFVDNLPNK